MRAAKTLLRLGGFPDWSESSLGAHAILLILTWGGSFVDILLCGKSCWITEQVAQRATIAHLSPMCQVNLPQNLMQPFPYPNDATHKIWSIDQLAPEIFKFESVKFSSLKGK